MAEPFVGEIRMFAGTFAPRGWADCDGQLLAISQNDALFSLLGTIYGGDGRTTFGLPDLRGRIPLHAGSGPGLSNRPLGQKGGQERVTLVSNQLPSHSHVMEGVSAMGGTNLPTGRFLANSLGGNAYAVASPDATLATGASPDSAGGTQPHNNLQPCQVIRFIIALVGIYPSRT